MIREFINNYFGFNKQQRNGLFVLLCISFLLLIVRISYPYFIKPDPIGVYNLPLMPINDLKTTNTKGAVTVPFLFDPNTASQEELLALGFNRKTSATIIKYRKRHPFKKNKDLLQVFGVNERLYAKLEPFIVMGKKPAYENTDHKNVQTVLVSQQPSPKVELNRADSISLEALKGIGPAFARRIVKYRESLGGYHTVEQVKEVYGMTDDLYNTIVQQVTVDSNLVKPIKINTDDFKTINRHPYISYEQTKIICNERKKAALNAASLAVILNDQGVFFRLSPYIRY